MAPFYWIILTKIGFYTLHLSSKKKCVCFVFQNGLYGFKFQMISPDLKHGTYRRRWGLDDMGLEILSGKLGPDLAQPNKR